MILEYLHKAFDELGVTVLGTHTVEPVVFHSAHARNLLEKNKLIFSVNDSCGYECGGMYFSET